MQAGKRDTPIYIESKTSTPDPVYGRPVDTWLSIVMKPNTSVPQPIMAEWEDALPSRSEVVQRGMEIARNQTRVRISYRADVDSKMRVRKVADVNRLGDAAPAYQIIGGPAEIGRKELIELMVERYSEGGNA